MIITVTKQDIQDGQRRDPEQCAIARALVRAGLDHCGVMGPSVMLADAWGRLTSMKLPEVISDWVFNFDAGNPVSPISFELEVPAGAARPTRKRQPREKAAPPKPASDFAEYVAPRLAPCLVSPIFTRRGHKMPKAPKLGGHRARRSGMNLKTS